MDSPVSPAALRSAQLELLTVGSFDPLAGGFRDIDYTGRLIDGYAVESRIGRGGMADVYRARDTALRCEVALKILRPRLASPDMCARMIQEAQAAAAIQHPHMLRVFKIGTLPGSAYLAMELLHGSSFNHWLHHHGGRLPWREVVAMLVPAMDALHEAHEIGLIHRDVKAENLFVTTRARDPRFVIVLDLGIAKADAAFRGPDGPGTTPPGRIVGTPTHMAPEQIEDQPVDRRCDVYAMGVTLYHALTGRLPFPPVPGSLMRTMQRHLSELPPPLRTAAPDADIPAALELLVMQTLAKRRDDRPPSMRALAEALESIVATTPPTRPTRRTPSIAWTLALVLLTALLWVVTAPSVAPTPLPTPPLPDRIRPAETLAPRIPDMSLETAPAAPTPPPVDVEPPRTRDPQRHTARRRALDNSPALAACRRDFGGDDPLSLSIELTVEATGAVSQARVRTPDVTLATACIEAALLNLQLAPGPRREIIKETIQGGRP